MRTIAEIKQALADGSYDALLSRLYCRPAHRLSSFRDRIIRVSRVTQQPSEKMTAPPSRSSPPPAAPRSGATIPIISGAGY